MINLNNLTPWEAGDEDSPRDRHNRKENRDSKDRTRGSFNFGRPSTLPHNERSKTPVLIEILEATKGSMTAMKKKRMSLDDNEENRNKRRRRHNDFASFLPLAQNQFPMDVVPTTVQKAVEPATIHTNPTTKIECPQLDHIETLIQSERRFLKLQSMPPLKIKSSHKRKSHSQLTLHNLHYFEPRKSHYQQPPAPVVPKMDFNSTARHIFKTIKKKEISPAKKVKTVIAFQTVRIVRFDEKKAERSPKKAYSKMRVEHFLDGLLEKMK